MASTGPNGWEPRPVPGPFFGRAAELAAVCDLLAAAQSGIGQVLVLQGEAGIGKTRLLDEALADARRLGFDVLRGAADELEHDRPFRAVADALGLDAHSPDPDEAEIVRAVTGETAARGATATGAHPADAGFRVVESVVAVLERRTSGGPVCLVLEDLHWADPATLRTLRSILRGVAQLPMALLLSLRPFPRSPQLDRVLDDADLAGGHRLVLGGFDDDDVAALTQSVAGAPPGPRLLSQARAAGGNPLFVIELVGGLRAEGLLHVAEARAEIGDACLPPNLRRVILRRVGLLPETTIEMLKVATVLGSRFPMSLLCDVMGRGPGELLSPVEQALHAGVLRASGCELAFGHDLIRDVMYQELALPLRRGLHRETARALSASGAPLSQVAEQFFLGAAPGDAEALAWLTRGADQAARQSPTTAVKLLQRALELVPRDAPEVPALVCELAPLLIQIGRPDEAARLTRQVLDGDPGPEVEVSLRRALGEVLWTQGWLEPAIDELETAAGIAGAPESDRRGSLALAAYLKLFVGEPRAARKEAERVQAAGEGAGDDFASCLAFQTLALVATAEARVADATESAQAAVAIARRSEHPRIGHLHPDLSLGLVLLSADRLADAETVLQEGRRRAEWRGTVVWLPLYHAALAIRRAITGEWDDTLAEAQVGLRLADEVGTRLFAPFLHGFNTWVAYQRAELGAAQAGLDVAAREFLAATSISWQTEASRGLAAAGARWPLEWGLWLQGLLDEARGDDRGALVALDDAWAVSAPLRYFLGYRLFAPDLVRLAVRAGDRGLGSRVTEEVEEGARRSGVGSAVAAAIRCRGLLDEDADVLLKAVEHYRRTPCIAETAFTLEEAGTALARAARGAEAVAPLEEALAFYQWAGAARAQARADAVLRSVGVRRRRATTSTRAASGWESLTRTELAVARLAAEGLTNRQVGDRLFVSRRTVETHLAHVFAKLGIASRAQLAAEIARRERGA